MNKKAALSLGIIVTSLILLGVASIVGAIIQQITGSLRTEYAKTANNTFEYNVTMKSGAGVQNVTGWFDTMGTAIGAAAIITIIVGSLAVLSPGKNR